VKTLPVADTVAFAYRFAFAQLGTIIGLIWLPMVIIAVLQFLPYGTGDMALTPQQDPNAFGGAFLREIVYFLAIMLLTGTVCVAVMRQALGLRTGSALVHFALGRAEFRMAGGLLLLTGIMTVLALGVMLALGVGGLALRATGNPLLAALGGLVLVLGGAALLLVSGLRLSFLLVPITVAESRISFERGWTLTRGNFWRIAAVVFLVTLPTAVVVLSATTYLIGPQLFMLARTPNMPMEEFLERYQTIVNANIPAILGINLIVAPFSFGLFLGAAAAGYKALSDAAGVKAAAA
jgi:hypothetical protein